MSSRFVWSMIVLAPLTALPLGAVVVACSSDDAGSPAQPTNDAGADATGDATTRGPSGPGSACSCDADCVAAAGDTNAAICLHGMCATRASSACDGPNTEAGCGPGARCFPSTTLGENGVCLPLYDAASCTGGAQNRHGVCAPIKGQGCDASCGTLCEVPSPAPGTPGSACSSETECTLSTPTCYQGSGDAKWFDGYCLSFGCTDSSECAGGACLPVATDGSGVCVQACGLDLDCRLGYSCATVEGGTDTYCRAGCDAASSCPSGYTCLGTTCVDETIACSPSHPTGSCPGGMWCDQGVCSSEPFACDGKDDELEQNDTRETAKPVAPGVTPGLRVCSGNEDWYEVVVPKGKIVRVGIDFENAAGDLDLVIYDQAGELVGSRYGEQYPYTYRAQETNEEYYGLWSEAGGDKYYLRVVGHLSAENVYSLSVSELDYQDGADCTNIHTLGECTSQAPNGEKLLPFPFPGDVASFLGNNYVFDTYANYRFARRELVMLVRHAIAETSKAFPGTTPLGLVDSCQKNGITPGYDVNSPRHPETTHDQGGNIDIAYYQTDGDNHAEIICGDGSVHADGYCSPAAVTQHKVDLPRQAFFMAKLFAYARVRVIGVDQVIAPLLSDAATALNQLPPTDPKYVTTEQANAFFFKLAYGSGWPYHHHHIHLSLNWWTAEDRQPPSAGEFSPGPSMFLDPNRRAETLPRRALVTAWPPRR